MSRQLALSSVFAVLAMAAFALSSTSGNPDFARSVTLTGAEALASAPALGRLLPAGSLDLN